MWNLDDIRVIAVADGEYPLPGVPLVMPTSGAESLTLVIPIIEGLSAALIFRRRAL